MKIKPRPTKRKQRKNFDEPEERQFMRLTQLNKFFGRRALYGFGGRNDSGTN